MPGILGRYPMTSSLLCWAVIWELVGRLGLIQLLPPLSQVLGAMGEVVSTATFARAAVDLAPGAPLPAGRASIQLRLTVRAETRLLR